MATKITFHHFLLFNMASTIFVCVQGITDPTDVQALQVLYKSLNKAAQLTNWETCVGDPCRESWRGVTCQGTSVVSIQLPGLGLDGKLGYLLSGFRSLKTLDLSGNKIHDTIPYQLPPNLTSVNLANNNLNGTLPYSIATMFKLKYVNLSRNVLSQNIGDIFTNLTSLATLDLSHNNFTGDLPNSIISLSKLSTLNIANNNFTGSIPRGLLSLPTFRYDGNSFLNVPVPPPPPPPSPYTPPLPAAGPKNNTSRSPPSIVPARYDGKSSNTSNHKKLSVGAIIGICVGSTFSVNLGLQVLAFSIQQMKMKKIVGNSSKGSQPISAKVFSSNPTFPDNEEKIENFRSIPEKSVAQPSRSRSLVDEDEENALTLVDETSTGVEGREEEQREEEKKEGEEMTGKNKTTTPLSKKLKDALFGRMRKNFKRNPPTIESKVFSSNPTFPDNQEKIENFRSIPEKSVAQPSRSRSLVDEDEENDLTLVDETSTGVEEREEEQREEETKEGEEMTGKNKTTTPLSKKLKDALFGRMRKIFKRNPPTIEFFSSNPTFPDNQVKIENFRSIPEKSVAQPSSSRSLVDEDEENNLTLVDETSTGVEEREEEQREEENKEGEEMTGKNKTITPLSKNLKRNPPTSGSGVKKTKTNLVRESSSGISSHPMVVDLEKSKAPTGATPQVKTDGVSETSTLSKKDKGKIIEEGSEPTSQSLNIKLPVDFMKSNILEKEEMFPLMNNFLLPHNMERYKDAPIEDVDAHAVRLSFMAFQTSLALHAKMDKVKEMEVKLDDAIYRLEDEDQAKEELKGRLKESLDKVFASEAEVQTTKSSLVENEKETKTLNSALIEPKERVSKLEDQPTTFGEEKVGDLTDNGAIPTENVAAEEAVEGTHPSS